MPSYRSIKEATPEGQRILERLLLLRQYLAAKIPKRTLEETLLLATWNIREFDSPAYGDRIPEAFNYIAEIISRFDLIAIQEVRRDLTALERVMRLLGSNWRYLVTDATEGSKGNDERMAFIYDSNKVQFGGLASQLVLPPIEMKEGRKTVYVPATQVARTPFIAGFEAGWTRFMLTTVHILYGDSAPNDPRRVEEISQIAQFLRNRTLDPTAWSRNLILLGDFNIFSPEDATMQALTDAGFEIPPQLQNLPSNAPRTKFYDQIAFRSREGSLTFTKNAGVFNYYERVFKEEDEQIYAPYIGDAYTTTSSGEPRKDPSLYYRNYWRTFQMSDHLPMWAELYVDYSDAFLEAKRRKGELTLGQVEA